MRHEFLTLRPVSYDGLHWDPGIWYCACGGWQWTEVYGYRVMGRTAEKKFLKHLEEVSNEDN